MSRRAKATIDLSALRHNFTVVRQSIQPNTRVISMVKANAYGHGLVPVAHALSGSDYFGVACIDEAVQLREAGVTCPIVVMKGFLSSEDLHAFVEYELSSVVHDERQCDLLERTRLYQPISVWFKFDSGMHRLGFVESEALRMLRRLQGCQSVQQPLQLLTHLADADNTDRVFTELQLDSFHRFVKNQPGLKSVCNSAALLAFPKAQYDVVRPGIMLYGASPFMHRSAADFQLKPVMHLTAPVIAIKTLKRGDRVGYNGTWEAPEAMRVGVIGIGYGDGYPRHAHHGTPVSINNVCCPLIGRVSMDMITVDLRLQPNVRVGDDAVLWGAHLPIEKVAAEANTISYELFCRLTPRIKFEYLVGDCN